MAQPQSLYVCGRYDNHYHSGMFSPSLQSTGFRGLHSTDCPGCHGHQTSLVNSNHHTTTISLNTPHPTSTLHFTLFTSHLLTLLTTYAFNALTRTDTLTDIKFPTYPPWTLPRHNGDIFFFFIYLSSMNM